MLPFLTSEKMTTNVFKSQNYEINAQKNHNNLELPVPSKPLLIGIIYLALRIRRSWILPNDIIRWICDGKIPYITLYSLIPPQHRYQFRSFTHTHRIFNRDNLYSQTPLSSMNIIFHSILLSQLMGITYPSLNGPLHCYVMTLSLGLPYHIIWPIIVKLSHLYSFLSPINECQLFQQFYSENIALTVFTSIQLSPCWLTTWSYEPYRLLQENKPQEVSVLSSASDSTRYCQVIEEPPLIRNIQRVVVPPENNEIMNSLLYSSFQSCSNFKTNIFPYRDQIFLPKSISESDQLINRANLIEVLSHFQNTMRTIDRSTRIGGLYDNSGFLAFNSTLVNILNHPTPSGKTLLDTLLFNPSSFTSSIGSATSASHSQSQSHSQFSSFSQSNLPSNSSKRDSLSQPLPQQYDNSIYSYGSTILPGNPIMYSYVPHEESQVLKRAYAHVSLTNKSQKRKYQEFYSYMTYQGCNSEQSVGTFHPPYQMILERISKHMLFSCGYLYSLQSDIDEKFLLIAQNIHQNYQRKVQAQQRLQRYELHQLANNSSLVDCKITKENILEYHQYCKYVFPMLQKFAELNEFDDQDNSLPDTSHQVSHEDVKKEETSDDNDEGDNEENEHWLFYSRSRKGRDVSNHSKLRFNFMKESSYQDLWSCPDVYQTLNRMMKRSKDENDDDDDNPSHSNEKEEDDVDDDKEREETPLDFQPVENEQDMTVGVKTSSPSPSSQSKKRTKKKILETISTTKINKRKRKNSRRFKDGGLPLQPKPIVSNFSFIDNGFHLSRQEDNIDELNSWSWGYHADQEGNADLTGQQRSIRSKNQFKQTFSSDNHLPIKSKYEFLGDYEHDPDLEYENTYHSIREGGEEEEVEAEVEEEEEIEEEIEVIIPKKRRRELSKFIIEKAYQGKRSGNKKFQRQQVVPETVVAAGGGDEGGDDEVLRPLLNEGVVFEEYEVEERDGIASKSFIPEDILSQLNDYAEL